MLEELPTTLTLRQRDAVERTSGPLLILAGAGTGKTTTITAKIAFMIEKQGVESDKILTLTFSREAARNMEKKISEILRQGTNLKVSTFHAFCAELIRDNSEKCGVSEQFTIFEEIDAAILIYKELGTTSRNAALYSSTIAKAKDLNISISKFKDYLETGKKLLLNFAEESRFEQFYNECKVNLNTFHLKDKTQQKALKDEKKNWQEFIGLYDEYRKYTDFIHTWEIYEERKKTLNCLDYGDLNRIALDFLNTYGTVELNDTYTQIIVDEFQDTNYVQFELIKHLTAREKNITVVADANQSIYAFRGAYSNNIEEFKKQFVISEKDIVSLDTSFRSTNKILKVSHRLISHNYPEDRKSECLLLKNCNDNEGKNVVIQETKDDGEEARKIVEQIENYIEKGIPLKEIAVLYRTHNQGRQIRRALQRREIPMIVKDDADYLKQPEIKTVLSYLYILNNLMDPTPRGTEAWWRLFHYNNSLENSDSVQIGEYVKKNKISFQEAIYHHLDEIRLSENGFKTVEKVKETIRVLSEKKLLDVSDLLLEIYDLSGIVRHLNGLDTLKTREAFLNLRNLHEIAKNFEQFHNRELFGFIDYLEILDEMDGNPAPAKIREDDAVSLMSIHAAKGLEFRVVFVTSMAKDKFPILRGGQDFLIPLEMMEQYRDFFSARLSETELEKAVKERKKEIRLEEERRLCYVAFTRAKEDLILSLSLEYGGKEREPSEFLMEIGYDHWRDLEIPMNKGTNAKIETEAFFDALDLSYRRDFEIKTAGLVRDNELEREKNKCIQLLIESLDKDLEEAVHYLMVYRALKDGVCGNYLEKLQKKWGMIDPAMRAGEILAKIKARSNGLRFNPETFSFNFSALKAYENCPKQYELQEILRMPSRKNEDSTGAMIRGSFVHKVLETAVKEKVAEKQALYEIAETLHKKPEWMYTDLESTLPLFEVFWIRNKDRISNNLMVEQWFSVPINGFVFKGIIDRIDLLDPSKKEVEIIDYKTGKYDVSPEDRSRQLLLYAKGFEHMYPGYRAKRLTLDMLAIEKPRSFELQEDGEYRSNEGRVSPLDKGAITSMVETARNIAHDYEHGFGKTEDPDNCKECEFRLYCEGINI
ncbi:AAA family ATPase [Methanosarcina sp. DH2]|jgi:DNA helicase-2/ATP-dependent DNA helicase PcrA|uniref:ATP-dependent helicase n=1 Tax=Methanosarcina sp. DH2 TaxID=2605639 RepID=UPI001E31CE1C|nr:ATP-dependent helicase [Methanosarcina sp. DH2]MCC4771291.1 AAA family ATPase [Methanosarcina sp. DH2]